MAEQAGSVWRGTAVREPPITQYPDRSTFRLNLLGLTDHEFDLRLLAPFLSVYRAYPDEEPAYLFLRVTCASRVVYPSLESESTDSAIKYLAHVAVSRLPVVPPAPKSAAADALAKQAAEDARADENLLSLVASPARVRVVSPQGDGKARGRSDRSTPGSRKPRASTPSLLAEVKQLLDPRLTGLFKTKSKGMSKKAASELAVRLLVATAMVLDQEPAADQAADRAVKKLARERGKDTADALRTSIEGRLATEQTLLGLVRDSLKPRTRRGKQGTASRASGHRCARCGHRERDHNSSKCLVCFSCTSFVTRVPERSNPRCRCTHRAKEHAGQTGRCQKQFCSCPGFRPATENQPDSSTSVRTVSGGLPTLGRR